MIIIYSFKYYFYKIYKGLRSITYFVPFDTTFEVFGIGEINESWKIKQLFNSWTSTSLT